MRTQAAAALLPHPLLFFEEIDDGVGHSRSLWTVVPSSSIAGSENMFIVKICAGINNVCKKEVVEITQKCYFCESLLGLPCPNV